MPPVTVAVMLPFRVPAHCSLSTLSWAMESAAGAAKKPKAKAKSKAKPKAKAKTNSDAASGTGDPGDSSALGGPTGNGTRAGAKAAPKARRPATVDED